MAFRSLIAWCLLVAAVTGLDAYAQNSPTPVPSNGRKPRIAPPDQWPHACSFISLEDVKQIFPDKVVRPPNDLTDVRAALQRENWHFTPGKATPPDTKRCLYWVAWTEEMHGQQMSRVGSAGLTILHMVESPEVGHKYYSYSCMNGHAADIAGLGDEASVSGTNRLCLRKGLLTVSVTVPGAWPGTPEYAERKRQVTELARLVAARMP